MSSNVLGNASNTIVLINSLVFVFVIIAQERGWMDIVSPAFLADGFCVANKQYSVFVQSHALCFYVDTVFALFFWVLCGISNLSEEALEPVKKSILPTFGHGCAHMFLALYGKQSGKALWEESGMDWKFFRGLLMLSLFWFLFMCSIFGADRGRSRAVLFASAYTFVHTFFVPSRFGFTYVQTMLLVTFSIHSIGKQDKGPYYNVSSVLIGLPIGFVSWIEALACDNFFVHIGGHVWYDTVIPLSHLAYYVYVCYAEKKVTKVE